MLSEKTADQVRRWVGLPLGSTVLDVTRSATSRGYHVAYRPTVGCTLQVLFCEDEVRSDVWELLACAARECLGVEHPTAYGEDPVSYFNGVPVHVEPTDPVTRARKIGERQGYERGYSDGFEAGASRLANVPLSVPGLAAASNVMACVADALMVKRVTEHGVREMAAMLATRVVQAQLDKLAASADWSARVREGVKQSKAKRKEQEARAVGWDPEPDL